MAASWVTGQLPRMEWVPVDVEHVALPAALRTLDHALGERQAPSEHAVPSARPLLQVAMGPQAPPMGPDPLAEMRLLRRVVLSVQ